MDIVKTLVRVLLFITTIAAVAVLAIVGIQFVMDQTRPAPEVDPSALAEPVDRQVDLASPEEFVISLYLRLRGDELEKPVSTDDTPIQFTVEQGDTGVAVAERLQQEGLISDAGLFRWYMRNMGIDSRLEAGDYQLTKAMSMKQVAEALQHANMEETTIRIIEGWRAEQIAEMLALKGLASADMFMQAARSASLDYSSLNDRPAGATLEGYLFPDTYRVSVKASPEEIVGILASTFDQRFDENRRQQAVARGLSVFEVVTLASIVEREAVVSEERPLIASVYLNRIDQGMYLQADPTVQYALGFQPDSGQWWLLPLPLEALTNTVSTYNTYLNPGLPPGPICNPSLASIDAVLNPAQSEYLYFYSRGDGTHAFASTYEEHLQNQSQYQQ